MKLVLKKVRCEKCGSKVRKLKSYLSMTECTNKKCGHVEMSVFKKDRN